MNDKIETLKEMESKINAIDLKKLSNEDFDVFMVDVYFDLMSSDQETKNEVMELINNKFQKDNA